MIDLFCNTGNVKKVWNTKESSCGQQISLPLGKYKTLCTDVALLLAKACTELPLRKKNNIFSLVTCSLKIVIFKKFCHLHCNEIVINVPEHVL